MFRKLFRHRHTERHFFSDYGVKDETAVKVDGAMRAFCRGLVENSLPIGFRCEVVVSREGQVVARALAETTGTKR